MWIPGIQNLIDHQFIIPHFHHKEVFGISGTQFFAHIWISARKISDLSKRLAGYWKTRLLPSNSTPRPTRPLLLPKRRGCFAQFLTSHSWEREGPQREFSFARSLFHHPVRASNVEFLRFSAIVDFWTASVTCFHELDSGHVSCTDGFLWKYFNIPIDNFPENR